MLSKSITTIIFSIMGIVFIAIAVYGAAVKKGDSESEKYKDWTPYENPEAGFSLMRPKSFVVYEDKIEHPRESEYPKEIIFASKPRPERPNASLHFYTDTGGHAIIVRSGNNYLNLTLEEWIKKNIRSPLTIKDLEEQKKDREIKIAGQRAFIVKTLGGELYEIEVFLITKEKYFIITLIPFLSKELLSKYPEHKDSVKTLHLMLESFKLIGKSK